MENRRPLATRGTWWAKQLSGFLLARGVKPNQVSLASIVMAFGTALSLVGYRSASENIQVTLLILAAIFIQLRLLCNMLDGMLAVEGGLRSPLGDLYNDIPDRISDILTFLSVGFAIREDFLAGYGMTLGWLAALVAVLTAYLRLLGAACGTPHYFLGPMAKQHRMALMTGTLLISAFIGVPHHVDSLFACSLFIVIFGGSFSAYRRLQAIGKCLMNKSAE